MNKSIFKGFLIGVLLLAAIPALAQGGPDRRGMHGGQPPAGGEPPIERMLERLELTEDQRVEIDALLAQARESDRGKMEQLREHRQEMKQLLEADEVDEGAYRRAAQQAGELEADLALARSRTMKQVRAQLTPEQQAQAEKMKERRGDMRRGSMRGRGGPAAGRHPRGGKREFDE